MKNAILFTKKQIFLPIKNFYWLGNLLDKLGNLLDKLEDLLDKLEDQSNGLLNSFFGRENVFSNLKDGLFRRGLCFAAVLDPDSEQEGEPDEGEDSRFEGVEVPFSRLGGGGEVAGRAFGLEDVLGLNTVFLF